jgi:hypothetical protein
MRGMNEQGAIVNGVMQAVRDVAEPESLLPAAQMLPGMLGRAVEQMIYSQVASRDPLDALARADQLPPGETRRMLTSQAIVQLASSDPAGALAWLGAQQSRLDSNDWVSVAAVLSGQNPSLAAEYAPSVPESARGEWISAVARGMAARDVDGALSWLGTYRNTDYYDAAVAGVAQQLVSYDPQRAAQLLGDIDVDSPMAQAAVTGVAAMWAASDEDGAIDWATDLPRGDTRDRALIALAPRIGERLLDDAMLDLFSNEPVRNSAAGAAITAVARTDPARAQDLVNTHISNPQLAQEIGAIIENGGQGGRVATFMLAPGAAGAAPAGGTFIYSDVAAPLPQFTVRSDVNTVILRGPETEQ